MFKLVRAIKEVREYYLTMLVAWSALYLLGVIVPNLWLTVSTLTISWSSADMIFRWYVPKENRPLNLLGFIVVIGFASAVGFAASTYFLDQLEHVVGKNWQFGSVGWLEVVILGSILAVVFAYFDWQGI